MGCGASSRRKKVNPAKVVPLEASVVPGGSAGESELTAADDITAANKALEQALAQEEKQATAVTQVTSVRATSSRDEILEADSPVHDSKVSAGSQSSRQEAGAAEVNAEAPSTGQKQACSQPESPKTEVTQREPSASQAEASLQPERQEQHSQVAGMDEDTLTIPGPKETVGKSEASTAKPAPAFAWQGKTGEIDSPESRPVGAREEAAETQVVATSCGDGVSPADASIQAWPDSGSPSIEASPVRNQDCSNASAAMEKPTAVPKAEGGSAGLTEDQVTRALEAFGLEEGSSPGATKTENAVAILDIAQKSGMLTEEGDGMAFDEFLSLVARTKPEHKLGQNFSAEDEEDELCVAAFEVFDKNHDGFLCHVEMKEALEAWGEPCDDDAVRRRIAAADLDKDGRLSYAEFRNVVRATGLPR